MRGRLSQCLHLPVALAKNGRMDTKHFSKLLGLNDQHSSTQRQGLQRILLLRALVMLTALVAATGFAMFSELELPLLPVVILSVLVSVSIVIGYYRLRHSALISQRELFLQLALDAVFLCVVLLYTGGVSNPLISYLLVLLAVAATLLRQMLVNAYAVLSIAVYTLFLAIDLQGEAEHVHHGSTFQLHLVGMWVTFVVSAILITMFITRMAATIRRRELNLAQARENEMRNEQLIAIGTLAAGTAHALGTPLSTMAVLLGDLERQDDSALQGKAVREDIRLLREQVNRCKESLNSLTRFYNKEQTEDGDETTLGFFVDDIADYITNVHPRSTVEFQLPTDAPDLAISADPALKHALINIIENAVKAATDRVQVSISHGADSELPLQFAILDDGPGIPPEVMENMGEPFISTRKDSMGLGIFLANAAIQRLGGSIEMFNRREGGAMTVIRLPMQSDREYLSREDQA